MIDLTGNKLKQAGLQGVVRNVRKPSSGLTDLRIGHNNFGFRSAALLESLCHPRPSNVADEGQDAKIRRVQRRRALGEVQLIHIDSLDLSNMNLSAGQGTSGSLGGIELQSLVTLANAVARSKTLRHFKARQVSMLGSSEDDEAIMAFGKVFLQN